MPNRLNISLPNTAAGLHMLADLIEKRPEIRELVSFGDGAPAPAVPLPTPGGPPVAPQPTGLGRRALAKGTEPRFHRVHWKKHTKAKARWWTATLEGRALRVERREDASLGVVFDGFDENGHVFQGKQMAGVQERVETHARDVLARA